MGYPAAALEVERDVNSTLFAEVICPVPAVIPFLKMAVWGADGPLT